MNIDPRHTLPPAGGWPIPRPLCAVPSNHRQNGYVPPVQGLPDKSSREVLSGAFRAQLKLIRATGAVVSCFTIPVAIEETQGCSPAGGEYV